MSARTFVAAIGDLVFGAGCAGCGQVPAALLCPDCAAALSGPPRAVQPTPCPAGFPPTWAVAPYVDPVRAVLLAHKERGRLALARPLGRALARTVIAAAGQRRGPVDARPVVLVPVPSRPGSVRDRGHDPVLRMAVRATRTARSAGIAVRTLRGGLRHRRQVADQAGLERDARRRNLHRSLTVPVAARPLVAGTLVVVVDDVVTTGATLTEARRAIMAAGATEVRAAVIAATVRQTSPS